MKSDKANSIPYTFKKKPGVKDVTSPSDIIPIVKTETSVGNDELASEMQQSSTVTIADAAAVLTALKGLFSLHLSHGEMVRIDGIGSFQVKIAGTAVSSNDSISFPDMHVKGIQFRPSRELLKTLASCRFHEVVSSHVIVPKANDILPDILRHIDACGSISAPELQQLKHISVEKSRAILQELEEAGHLRCTGVKTHKRFIRA